MNRKQKIKFHFNKEVRFLKTFFIYLKSKEQAGERQGGERDIFYLLAHFCTCAQWSELNQAKPPGSQNSLSQRQGLRCLYHPVLPQVYWHESLSRREELVLN